MLFSFSLLKSYLWAVVPIEQSCKPEKVWLSLMKFEISFYTKEAEFHHVSNTETFAEKKTTAEF